MRNTRVSFAKNSAGVVEITDANDYYPFGIDPKSRAQTPTATGLTDSPFFVSLGHELGHKKDKNIYTERGWF